MSRQRIVNVLKNLPGMSPEMILERFTSFENDNIHISFDDLERVCIHVNERINSLATLNVETSEIPTQLARLEKHITTAKKKNG